MIHWSGIPKGVCERKDARADETSETQGETTITNTAIADHRGNVDCAVCLRAMRHPTILRRIRELDDLINNPEIENFLEGVRREAAHQVERWGTSHDRAKRPADWFWLVGYLAGKALHSALAGDNGKARHHCISTAAALFNWHSAIIGRDKRMAPGSSDVAKIVDAAFPGEAT